MSAQPQGQPDIKYKVVCKLCGHEFKADPFARIIGSRIVDSRRMKMGQVLAEHAMRQHAPILQGMMMASLYQFEDPVLLDEVNPARWHAHQLTAKNFLTDDAITEQCSKAGFDEEQIKFVLQLRDLLTETGSFALQAQPELKPAVQV